MPKRQVRAIYDRCAHSGKYVLINGQFQKVDKPEEYHQMTIQEWYLQEHLI